MSDASRLTLGDRMFIRAVAGNVSSVVGEMIARRDGVLAHATGETARTSLRSQAGSLVTLLREVLRSRAASGAFDRCDAAYYDWSVDGIDQVVHEARRESFLRYFTQFSTLKRLDQRTAIRVVVRPWNSLWLVFVAAIAAAFSVFQYGSALGLPYGELLRRAVMAEGYGSKTTTGTVYLFRPYHVDVVMITAYLMRSQVHAVTIASSTPLWPAKTRLIGSTVVLCNPYQEFELRSYASMGRFGESVLWGPEDIGDLVRYSTRRPRERVARVLGVYTQGFWLRRELEIIKPDLGRAYSELEDTVLECTLKMVRDGLVTEVLLLPHPLERRYLDRTLKHYSSIVAERGVRLHIDGHTSSADTFDEVGLGLTTFSTVGFDRLYCGFKTFFYVGNTALVDWDIESPFHGLFLRTPEDLHSSIIDVLDQTDAEFMMATFGRERWLGDPT